jgi:ferrous iron transport protein B
MLELPVYRRPQWKTVFRQTFSRVRGYVFKAGPVIFILSLIIWAGCTFPHFEEQNKSERLTHSYAATMGQAIEPLMEPMGFDWRVGIGLISAFAAREVFVSSLAVVFNITDQTDDEESLRESLLQKMSEAKAHDGLPLFTVASVIGLILFFMIALQCISTVGVARREFGSWSWAISQLILFNGVAYGLTVFVVQGLRALGIS